MKHPAELALHQYMEDAVADKTTISADTIEQVASDIKDALQRQFGSDGRKGDFRLRMSNIGRPSCQLWYEKNKPEVAVPLPTTFIMNMMLGDIVEAVFKGLLKEIFNPNIPFEHKNRKEPCRFCDPEAFRL